MNVKTKLRNPASSNKFSFAFRRKNAILNVRFVIANRPEPWIHSKFTSKRGQLLHRVSLDQTPETNEELPKPFGQALQPNSLDDSIVKSRQGQGNSLCLLYVSTSTNAYQNEILSITELLLGLDAGESYSALRSVHSLLHIPQSFIVRTEML